MNFEHRSELSIVGNKVAHAVAGVTAFGSVLFVQSIFVSLSSESGCLVHTQPLEKIMKMMPIAALCILVLLAAGCSGAPSETDIKAAFEKDMAKTAQSIDEAGKMFGGMGKSLTDSLGKMELHAVKKIGCTEAKDAPGFVCDVEIDMTVPIAGRSKEMATARFVNGPDGWIVVK
jgi:hypothetical protein